MMKWEMKYHEYMKFCNETKVEGFSNGHKFDDFKKGQVAGYFDREVPEGKKPEFKIGKVIEVLRARNADGKDTIRKVTLEVDGVQYSVSGHKHINTFLFLKDEKEPEKPKAKSIVKNAGEVLRIEDDVTEDGTYEVVEIERAMSPKNPRIKELLAEGWNYVGRIWNNERNMYIATVRRLKAEG